MYVFIKFILIEINFKVGPPMADIDFVLKFDTISLDYLFPHFTLTFPS